MMRVNFYTLTSREPPYLLRLADNSELHIAKIVRELPAKRLVVRAVWRGQPVYAKIFFGHKAADYLARDVAGVNALSKASILTPPLLYQGQTQDGVGHVAIFAAIEPAQNAEEVYAQVGEPARLSLMQSIVKTVVQHHKAGLIQTDLYFKNFLVQDKYIYTLDGDGIRKLRPFNQKGQRLQNLATLFSKMDVMDDIAWSQELHQLYCQEMRDPFDGETHSVFWQNTQKIRAKVCSNYADKKVFRNCTDVKVMQDFKHFVAVARDYVFENKDLKALDTYLSAPAKNIKNGNTCTIAKTYIGKRDAVVKRYNIKGLWHGVRRAFRKSRAAISWANAYRMTMLNIATPKPLALIEERIGLLRKRAYFLSEFVDAPDITEFFAKTTDVEMRRQVTKNVAAMFYRLYLLKISHGDCKASNIKIQHEKPILLDLDAMQANRMFFERKHIKDLKRFMRNWQHDSALTALFKEALVQEYGNFDDFFAVSVLSRAGITLISAE